MTMESVTGPAPLDQYTAITRATLDSLSAYCGSNLEIELLLPGQLLIRAVDDERYYGRFPAAVESNREATTVKFHTETFAGLQDIGAVRSIADADMVKLYVGAGLVLCAMGKMVRPSEVMKVDRLTTIMCDLDDLTQQVRTSRLTDEDQMNTLLAIAKSSDDRLCGINSLRFAVGVLFAAEQAAGQQEKLDILQDTFLDEIITTLAGRETYIRFQEGVLKNDRLQAEANFAEGISDLDLAVAFPMSPSRINVVLGVCRWENPGLEPSTVSSLNEGWRPKSNSDSQ